MTLVATRPASSLLGKKLKRVGHAEAYPFGGIGHWCPGCRVMHVFPTSDWDGSREQPTVSSERRFEARGFGALVPATLCRYQLMAGVLRFMSDCTHALAGKSVPLPDLPGHLWTEQ